jgi:endonuclease YncB( thermonuclease family)
MRRPWSILGWVGFLALVPSLALGKPSESKPTPSFLKLNGSRERVRWNDGDSFRILEGSRKDEKGRMVGYNTLESYGPVHYWGDFHGWELYRLAKDGQKLAAASEWECQAEGQADGYGRLLVDCPELRRAMVAQGLGHVFAVGGEPDAEALAAQMKAQNQRKGIWQKGIPGAIVTSLHAISEERDGQGPPKTAYNRVCDTQTGKSYTVEHQADFKPCDTWCHRASCMIYVPFDSRYGAKRPACVKGDEGERNHLTPPPHLGYPLRDR